MRIHDDLAGVLPTASDEDRVDAIGLYRRCLLHQTIAGLYLSTALLRATRESTEKLLVDRRDFVGSVCAVGARFRHEFVNTVHCVFAITNSYRAQAGAVLHGLSEARLSDPNVCETFDKLPWRAITPDIRQHLREILLTYRFSTRDIGRLAASYLQSEYFPFGTADYQRFTAERGSKPCDDAELASQWTLLDAAFHSHRLWEELHPRSN